MLGQARLAHYLVGDARPVKGLDQGDALAAQPVQHRKVGKAADLRVTGVGVPDAARIAREHACPAHHLLDAVHDGLRFGPVGGDGQHGQLDRRGEVGDQPLRFGVGVVGDDLPRRVQQRLGRAIALAQMDRDRAGKVGGELAEEAVVGPAKAVDGLVRVADDADIGPARGQPPQPLHLGEVDILIFVHREPVIAGVQRRGDGGLFRQQPRGQHH